MVTFLNDIFTVHFPTAYFFIVHKYALGIFISLFSLLLCKCEDNHTNFGQTLVITS